MGNKFVVLDGNNMALAFYDSGVNGSSIPSGAIPISQTLWESWIGQSGKVAYQSSTGTLIPFTVAPTLAQLQAAVVAAATAAGGAVVAAIYPTPTMQAAFQNAAVIVSANGNAAPASTSPLYATFNSLAAGYGMQPAAFASLMVVAQNQSFALAAAETALSTAAAAATTSAALATALAAFQTALDAVVTALNAALPAPLPTPATITIAGVNA